MSVLVKGAECRQVGRVCMDQLMVEIPRGLDVVPGDEAVLVGGQDSARIEMDEQAGTLGTINYEIACGYGARLHRRFTSGP
jgi:alanine racemase